MNILIESHKHSSLRYLLVLDVPHIFLEILSIVIGSVNLFFLSDWGIFGRPKKWLEDISSWSFSEAKKFIHLRVNLRYQGKSWKTDRLVQFRYLCSDRDRRVLDEQTRDIDFLVSSMCGLGL
jgi:hypothetical protein